MQFAIQPNRVRDFSEESIDYTSRESTVRQLISANSLPDYLNQSAYRLPANPEIRRRIASGILNCFSSDRFDSFRPGEISPAAMLEKTTRDPQLDLGFLANLDDTVIEASFDKIVERKSGIAPRWWPDPFIGPNFARYHVILPCFPYIHKLLTKVEDQIGLYVHFA